MPQDMSLIQLGTANGQQAQPGTNQTEENSTVIEFHPTNDQEGDDRLDHFIEQNGVHFAGHHLIVDLWDASRLDDIQHIEDTFKECIEEAGATLLHMHFHHFSPTGVSGVAVLAESHISIHTWPEMGYAALDIFMCGDAEPHKAIPVLRRAFSPKTVQLGDHKRGMVG